MREHEARTVTASSVRRSRYNHDGTEGSTSRQEHEIRAYIKAHNLGVVAVPPYKEIVSAYDESAKRSKFDQILADLERGVIDTIVVWKIDRLCRRASQWERVVRTLRQSGGRLVSVSENIDTHGEGMSKAAMNIVLSILVSLAENESENTSARMKLMHACRASPRGPSPSLNSSLRPDDRLV